MREIDASQVTEAIAKLCVEANCFLAEDVRCALCTAERQEPFAPAREILHILCRNEQIARQERMRDLFFRTYVRPCSMRFCKRENERLYLLLCVL